MATVLFGVSSVATPLSTLLAFYTLHSTEAVRREAFSVLRHCPCDAQALRLLLHAIITETSSLRASAIEAGITVFQSMAGSQDASEKGPLKEPLIDPLKGPLKEPLKGPLIDPLKGPLIDPLKGPVKGPVAGTSAIQQAVFDALPLLLPPFHYGEVAAFGAAQTCKWCFFRTAEHADMELLTVLLSALSLIWGRHATPHWTARKQLVFCLLHAPAVLQDLLRIHYHVAVEIPAAGGDLPMPSPMPEESRPCPELEWARSGLEKLLQKYPALLQQLQPALATEPLQALTKLVDAEMAKYAREDGGCGWRA